MFKSSKGSGYKELAKRTEARRCDVSERPFQSVAVDVRSRVFRHMRQRLAKRQVWKKVKCVFGIILHGIETEVMLVLEETLSTVRAELDIIGCKAIYVFCSEARCPFREKTKIYERARAASAASKKLGECIERYKKGLLNVETIIICHTAFETYAITHLEDVCLAYNKALSSARLLDSMTIIPDGSNYFESDRLCAQLDVDAVLSEDFDCVALFGAKIMIVDVVGSSLFYVALSDVLDTFQSQDREDLVYKCCIMGTDYNLGLKRVGPTRIAKIDRAKEQALQCIFDQSIGIEELLKFFFIY